MFSILGSLFKLFFALIFFCIIIFGAAAAFIMAPMLMVAFEDTSHKATTQTLTPDMQADIACKKLGSTHWHMEWNYTYRQYTYKCDF